MKHMIGGLRHRRATFLAVPLVGIALLIALVGAATAASADSNEVSLVNGGFESSNLAGWQVTCGGGCDSQTAQAVASFDGNSGTFAAPLGNFFATLEGSCHDTTISQDFLAQAGEVLSGQAFFSVAESPGDVNMYDDYGSVELLQGNTVVATLFSEDAVSVGGDSDTPWTAFSYTIPSSGAYTIAATSGNGNDCSVDSFLGVDFESNLGGITVAPATQLWGNAVTITSPGGGLTATTSVLMNGSPAPFAVLNDHAISAMVVPGAGSGSVTLTVNTGSGAAVVPNAFTAIPPVQVVLPTTTPSPPPATTTPSPTTTTTPTSTATATPTSTATTTPTPGGECPSPAIALSGALTLTTWPGPDDPSIADVVANCDLSSVTAVWTYDASAQSWQAWFAAAANVEGANDITTFSTGTAYFFLAAAS